MQKFIMTHAGRTVTVMAKDLTSATILAKRHLKVKTDPKETPASKWYREHGKSNC